MKHTDKPVEKPKWFIVNMCNRWNEGQIQRGRKPTMLHASLALAYAEAVRLAETHSQGDYAIFECVGRVVSNPGKPLVAEPGTLART